MLSFEEIDRVLTNKEKDQLTSMDRGIYNTKEVVHCKLKLFPFEILTNYLLLIRLLPRSCDISFTVLIFRT